MKIPRDRQHSIESHIRNDDYFATLATVLDLARQTLGKSPAERKVARCLRDYTDDLMYLQDNWEIKSREK